MKEAPRFHNQIQVPKTPEGKQLVKFHGKPAFIPKRQENEVPIGGNFTQRQIYALYELELQRRGLIAKPSDGSGDYIIGGYSEKLVPAETGVYVPGINATPGERALRTSY